MNLIPEKHWLVITGRVLSGLVGLLIFVAMIRSGQTYEFWSWTFLVWVGFSLIIGGVVTKMLIDIVGNPSASLLYALFTHCPKAHWFPRFIIGGRAFWLGHISEE